MRPHHLEESLRTLKLFGMLDTVEARLAQASAGELGHVELLQSLCEDESTRRDAVGLERRLKAARFEQSCAIEDFDFAFNPKIPATQIRDLATLRFIEAGESVILHGPVGVGKSMIAQALGHLACRRGYSVLFTKTSRLLADLAGGHADRSFESRLARWARPTMVVFDLSRPRDYPDVGLVLGGERAESVGIITGPQGRREACRLDETGPLGTSAAWCAPVLVP